MLFHSLILHPCGFIYTPVKKWNKSYFETLRCLSLVHIFSLLLHMIQAADDLNSQKKILIDQL